GTFRDSEQTDPARIVHVLVERAGHLRARQRIGQRRGVGAAAEGEELHEQPAVRSLRLTVLDAALLADVGRRRTLASFSSRHDLLSRGAPAPLVAVAYAPDRS